MANFSGESGTGEDGPRSTACSEVRGQLLPSPANTYREERPCIETCFLYGQTHAQGSKENRSYSHKEGEGGRGFSYVGARMAQVSEHFRIVQKLGEGTYGKAVFCVLRSHRSQSHQLSQVYKAISRTTNEALHSSNRGSRCQKQQAAC